VAGHGYVALLAWDRKHTLSDADRGGIVRRDVMEE
jgi:hypothetical protein